MLGRDLRGRFEALPVLADMLHGADFDASDDGARGGGVGREKFAGAFGAFAGFEIGDRVRVLV